MSNRWMTALGIAVVLGLSGCSDAPRPGVVLDEGAQSESAGQVRAPAGDGRIWFEVLGVSQSAGGIGEIVAVTDAEAFDLAWAQYGFEGTTPAVPFDEQIVLVYVRPEDACPDQLVEVRLHDGLLETTWLPPPGGCAQPLIATAFAVALHRGSLPPTFTAVLREHEAFHADVDLLVELPPYEGPPPPYAPDPPRRMTDDEVNAIFAGHVLRPCEEMPDFTTDPVIDGPLSADPEVARIQAARAGMGLPSDEATARALLADSDANRAFGFPMANPEFDEVMARGDVGFQDDFQTRYVPAHAADTWAFMVLDQAAGGVFVLGFTDDLEAHRTRLGSEYPDVPVRVVQAFASAKDLEAAQQSLDALFGSEQAPRLLHTGRSTHVQAGLLDPTREDLDAIAQLVDPAVVCIEVVRSGVDLDS